VDLHRDYIRDVFESPFEIVSETLFTKGEKLGTLNRWAKPFLRTKRCGLTASHQSRRRVLDQIEEAKRHLSNANPPLAVGALRSSRAASVVSQFEIGRPASNVLMVVISSLEVGCPHVGMRPLP
jgi:hypothetical protein